MCNHSCVRALLRAGIEDKRRGHMQDMQSPALNRQALSQCGSVLPEIACHGRIGQILRFGPRGVRECRRIVG